MRARLPIFAALALSWVSAVLASGGAFAQSNEPDVDCTNPQVQIEMTYCAGKDLEAADAELNAVYRKAMARAKEMDRDEFQSSAVPVVDLLRDAQRAWIPFRDKACEVDASLWRGGTGASMALLICLTGLTEQRTRNLRTFLDFPE